MAPDKTRAMHSWGTRLVNRMLSEMQRRRQKGRLLSADGGGQGVGEAVGHRFGHDSVGGVEQRDWALACGRGNAWVVEFGWRGIHHSGMVPRLKSSGKVPVDAMAVNRRAKTGVQMASQLPHSAGDAVRARGRGGAALCSAPAWLS